MRKVIYFLLAIFGLFGLLGSGQIFFRISFQLFNRTIVQYYWFWLGLVAYLAIFLLFRKINLIYIFGHELAHATAGIFFGASLKKFRVSKNRGEVVLDKKNLFIALAPYFLPVYTLMVLAGFKLWHYFRPEIAAGYGNVFLFLLGLTLSFHLLHTLAIIPSKQSDWNYAGYFFSVIFIGLANIFVIILIMKVLFPAAVPFRTFLEKSAQETLAIIKFTLRQGRQVWSWLSVK